MSSGALGHSHDAGLLPVLDRAMRYRRDLQPFGMVRLPEPDGSAGQWLLAGRNEDADLFLLRVRGWMTSGYLDFGNPQTYSIGPQQVCRQSTAREFYNRQVRHAVDTLKVRGGKTVLCRTLCGDFAARLNSKSLAALAQEFFSGADTRQKLSFLFWHPDTGYWMGATPELVLEADGTALRTMALAGTMPADSTGPWSPKNIKEHQIVADYIQQTLRNGPIEFSRGQLSWIKAGNVRHLCTHFNATLPAKISSGVFDKIVAELEPTPALAGYPRNDALNDIAALEPYHRYFYAGIINVQTPRRSVAYGIIRCAHFDDGSWCIYSGGGLTAESDADEEWRETALKAEPLKQLFSTGLPSDL